MTEFHVGDKVLVNGPPPDVKGTGRGEHLFTDLTGTIIETPDFDEEYWKAASEGQEGYTVHLDEDLTDAANHGWISNDYYILAVDLTRLTVADDELSEVLASIQATAERKATP